MIVMSRLKTDILSEFSEKKRTGINRKNKLYSQYLIVSGSDQARSGCIPGALQALRLHLVVNETRSKKMFGVNGLPFQDIKFAKIQQGIFELTNGQKFVSRQCTTFIAKLASKNCSKNTRLSRSIQERIDSK